jgi:hypothetical protein
MAAHRHPHGHPHDHGGHDHGRGGVGHNGHRDTAQWQTPHLPDGHAATAPVAHEPDLDLVETAFVEAFPSAPDPTSFLRLAGVPFTGKGKDGVVLSLLRVEAQQVTDVGSVTPHLGGGGFRHDPLPAAMTSRRKSLAFVYFDGGGLVRLTLAEAKALTPVAAPGGA